MPKKPKKGSIPRSTIYLLIGLSVVLVVLASLASGEMSRLESELFDFIYGGNESWRNFALVVTQLGSIWLWLGLVALLLIRNKRPGSALAMLRNGVVTLGLVALTKWLIARPRPFQLFEDSSSRELLTIGFAFPSAHVALATVASLTLASSLNGRSRWILPPIWIGLVAWSRIYLGVHSPLDVLGGLVLGILVVIGVPALTYLSMNHKTS